MSEINKEVIDELEDSTLIAYHEIVDRLNETNEILTKIYIHLTEKETQRILRGLVQKDMKEAVLETKTPTSVITTKEPKKTLKSTTSKIFDYSIKHETEKAILIRNNKTDLVAWIPRKAIKFMDDVSITIMPWLKEVRWQEDQPWD